ncbi:AfsA-related hotdog domain-containing protein [Nocardia sp. NPDC004278]
MSSVIEPQLSFSTVVPREHVHRSAISEVFLTDIICEKYPRFRLGIQLPRTHGYYGDHAISGSPGYDPLLLLECSRQASILIAHRYVGAEMDQKFIFNTGALRVTDPAGLSVRDHPGYGNLDAVIVAEKRRDDVVIGIDLAVEIQIDARLVATMDMTIQWMPGEAWSKVRSRGRARLDLTASVPHAISRRIAPEFVARRNPDNVVIGSVTGDSQELLAEIIVDETHPGLFDHKLDHTPGAVLFEAFRQTGIVTAQELFGLSPQRLALTAVSATFHRFGEPELATYARARPLPTTGDLAVEFSVEVLQNDTVITEGMVALRRLGLTGQPLAGVGA